MTASRATTDDTARWLIRFLANCAIRSAMLSNGWLTPVSCSIEVMVTFAIPQGVIAPKGDRSPPTLRAKPCIVIQCRTPTPIEAILRLARRFRAPDPDTRQVGAPHRFDLRLPEQLNEQRFDPAQIAMQILSITAQVDEKITDQLPRPVIGRLAAAVDFEKRMRQMRRPAQTQSIGRATDGVNRFVLEQPQFVGRFGMSAPFPDRIPPVEQEQPRNPFDPANEPPAGALIFAAGPGDRGARLPGRANE